jgi:hypothetical protein
MRTMRGLAALALVAACATAGRPPAAAALDRDFRLERGETAAVGDDGLTVRFVAVVEDSRCPLGVQCVRAGEARVQLQLRAPGSGSDVVVLATEGGQPRYASLGPYDVHLVDVEPRHRTDDPHPPYVAILRVSRH